MSFSNQQHNRKETDAFRKELKAMLGDIGEIDRKCLNIAVNKGLSSAKRGTPVDTGFMRKMWGALPLRKFRRKGVEKSIYNAADYGSYVNDGHRIVNGAGETTGWVEGKFMLERAEKAVRRSLNQEFKKEVERVNKKYDK
jgi:hypothetical protein